MNRSSKHNKREKLKTPIKESHNQSTELIAFIEFLARCAAEEDYKSLTAQSNNHTSNGEEND